MSSFTDKRLLDLLDYKNLIMSRNFYGNRGFIGEILLTKDSSIKVLFENQPSVRNIQTISTLFLSFYHKEFIGEFSFTIECSPIDYSLKFHFHDVRFLDDFASPNGYLTKSASLERLMEYPEFKEWLIWNVI